MGRKNLRPVVEVLNHYFSPMLFNGQFTVVLGGDKAPRITYCKAYHIAVLNGVKSY
jgi:hypothetical protein